MSDQPSNMFARSAGRVHPYAGEQSRTKQAFRDETDVRFIMKKYFETGVIESRNLAEPVYGDFSNVDDYLSAVNQVKAAEEAFAALPSTVRERFDNDPGELLRAWNDPEQHLELEELGLVELTDEYRESLQPEEPEPRKPAPEPAPEPAPGPPPPSDPPPES